MNRVRIIPVLLLHKGGLYKTVGFKSPRYIGDPINSVRIFNEKEADELVLLDYRASVDGYPIDIPKISEIASEAFMPMAYGGGIRTLDDARKVFDAGFEKIILNSILFTRPHIISEVASIYGSQSVICSMDVKKNLFGRYKVYSHSASRNSGLDPVEWAKKIEGYGTGEILLNSIERDGTWAGYDTGLIEKVAEAVSIPAVACGGAGTINDLRKAVEAGASAVAAGSMFVFQKQGMGVLINFPREVLRIAEMGK